MPKNYVKIASNEKYQEDIDRLMREYNRLMGLAMSAPDHDRMVHFADLARETDAQIDALIGLRERGILYEDAVGPNRIQPMPLVCDTSNLHAANVQAIGYEYTDIHDLLGLLELKEREEDRRSEIEYIRTCGYPF